MISRLLDTLGELEEPPTAQELAEALWLAESLPAGRTAPLPMLSGRGPTVPADTRASGIGRADAVPDAAGAKPAEPDTGQATVHLRAPTPCPASAQRASRFACPPCPH